MLAGTSAELPAPNPLLKLKVEPVAGAAALPNMLGVLAAPKAEGAEAPVPNDVVVVEPKRLAEEDAAAAGVLLNENVEAALLASGVHMRCVSIACAASSLRSTRVGGGDRDGFYVDDIITWC